MVNQRLWEHVQAIHTAADLSLVPSTFSFQQLKNLGIDRLKISGRGVDTVQFTPQRRSEHFRQAVAPNGEVIIGYVGRLAAEKQVADLKALADLKNTRLVIVGSGPLEPNYGPYYLPHTSPASSRVNDWLRSWRL